MGMDWESLLDELWGHASSDPAEFEAKIRVCLNGYSSEGLLQATTLLITQKQHATARTLLSEFLRNHQAAGDIKHRLERILHFKQSRTPQALSLKCKQRSKEVLLKDVNDLVASGNLRAAETILFEANESIEEPDYLSLLGRIYMLQKRPLDAAKAIKRGLLLRRQQRAFVETNLVESEDDDLPRASDLAYLNDSATSLATLGPSSATAGQASSVEAENSLDFSQQATAQFPPLSQEGWWENHVELASKESSTLADETDAVDELETSLAATHDSEERASEDEATSPTPKKSILKLAIPRKITSSGETQASVHVIKKSGRSLGVIHTLSSSSLEADTDAVPAHSDLSQLSEPLAAGFRIHDDIFDEHDDDLPYAYPELGAPYGLGIEDPENGIDFDHDLHDLTFIDLGKEHEGDTSTVLDDFRDLDDDYAAYAFDPDEVFDSQEAVDVECNDWIADTLSREDRALQKAAELIVNANWPLSTLRLVQQIFVISGWGATRLALEREIEKGLTPDELILAAHIKVMWAENDIYWIAFDKTGSSRLSYYVLSWPTALLIVRSFDSLPQVEEIEFFLENLFTSWYENHTLRRVFKAFIRYVWFRFANLEGCLPANQHFDFCDPRELPAEEYSDLGLCDTLDIEKTERLRVFGVYQNKHPQEPSCYFSDKPLVIEEELCLNASGKRKRGENGPDATEPGLKSEDDTSRVDDVVDDEDAPQWSGAPLASALNTQTTDQPSPSIES
ncbi:MULTISPECIES: hypothetical protein [unclassified Pseudomonas]|jgi:hypothetical protein|uniref:hypothetical protein n=1 Tax=unclassified Pseudomonas TaxID=196821 RepID=UPI001F23C1A6|nr:MULTISPECIES: hypothetical protein [unclassified Pseudomonas]